MLAVEVIPNMSELAFPLEEQSLPSPSPDQAEGPVVARGLALLADALDWVAVIQTATPWVQAVRAHPAPFWALERLLQEFPISSPQGLALMRLAEALLRVPDLPTILALTADQLAAADFEHAQEGHQGHDHKGEGLLSSLMARAGALAHHLLPANADSHGLLAQLGARTVATITLRAVQLLGQQFVLGQTLDEALRQAQGERLRQARISPAALRYSFDMLGEGARTDADARRYLSSYENAIETIAAHAYKQKTCEANEGVSIKLSALHPRFEAHQRQRVMAELLPRVWHLCQRAAQANIPLTIDAEECERLEITLAVLAALAAQVAQHHPQWLGLGLAVQAYQTRALDVVAFVVALARQHRLRLMVRLVKGAYWDTEIKRAQTLGLPHYPVFTHKSHTDVAYLACARALLDAPDAIFPQFATHNAATLAAVLQLAARCDQTSGTPARFELQRLHGMGEAVYREVMKNPHIACRVYAPVGTHRDLLAYLVRRLLENGANASFVHQLVDAKVSVQALLASPLHLQTTSALPLPEAIFGPQRRNSVGCDLTLASARAPLQHAYTSVAVPQVPESDVNSVASAYKTCISSYQKWSNTQVTERAAILRQAALALEQQTPHFCALLVKEAHKTWANAVAECREAVDLLRYYADEAERVMQPLPLPVNAPGITGETNELRLRPRGVWVCISPWNFPLAIFVGQVAAALVTGNAVLAKPAAPTPGVAWAAVQLLHAAGVPADALQLLHGPGASVGAALVALPGLGGVVFTGSTPVAKHIQRALAAQDGPIVPLIAETGGINAMLVDSTALPEQVVDAVLQSTFDSAGQRCSALRLLCVHEAIADAVITMLVGACAELRVGDPADFATDVGPLIDAAAQAQVAQHVQRLNSEAKRLYPKEEWAQAAINSIANVVPPHVFEISHMTQVQHEIFGPVLQVLRWGSGDLREPHAVMAQINALGASPAALGSAREGHTGDGLTGYALTLGIQTRIDSRAQALAAQARAGNVYINRPLIGAVTGVQPFGGQALSGTGPKAGGPHYLVRFCTEQTVSVNTTAAGGNAALLGRVQ